MNEQKKGFYNLDEIKAIPLEDIASKYGIQLKKKGNRLWGKLRENEKTSSFSINLEKNLWYDFGSGEGGSGIDLVAKLDGLSPTDAINKLAVEHGLESEQTNNEWVPLTDRQYRKIGIQPERATLNFQFDLNKQTVEELTRWSDKYGVPVKELAAKHPKVYNKMLEKIALGEINELKGKYFGLIESYQTVITGMEDKMLFERFIKSQSVEINEKVDLLQRAIKPSYKGQRIDLKDVKVNYDYDIKHKVPARELQQNKNPDEKIRKHLVSSYKKLFNYQDIEKFSMKQIMALYQINKTLAKGKNVFISIPNIKEMHNKIGKRIDSMEQQYQKLADKRGGVENQELSIINNKLEHITKELKNIHQIFNQYETVIEASKNVQLDSKKERVQVAKRNELSFEK